MGARRQSEGFAFDDRSEPQISYGSFRPTTTTCIDAIGMPGIGKRTALVEHDSGDQVAQTHNCANKFTNADRNERRASRSYLRRECSFEFHTIVSYRVLRIAYEYHRHAIDRWAH